MIDGQKMLSDCIHQEMKDGAKSKPPYVKRDNIAAYFETYAGWRQLIMRIHNMA